MENNKMFIVRLLSGDSETLKISFNVGGHEFGDNP
jgi:hypothetical protein